MQHNVNRLVPVMTIVLTIMAGCVTGGGDDVPGAPRTTQSPGFITHDLRFDSRVDEQVTILIGQPARLLLLLDLGEAAAHGLKFYGPGSCTPDRLTHGSLVISGDNVVQTSGRYVLDWTDCGQVEGELRLTWELQAGYVQGTARLFMVG